MRDLTELPPDVRRVLAAWLDGLDGIFGPRLHAAYLYGSYAFPGSWVQDIDADALVDGGFGEEDRRAVSALIAALAALPHGDDMDVWYLDLVEARGRALPGTQLDPAKLCHAWPLHRAHIHAGAYVRLRGPDPTTIVPEASWDEIDDALMGELEYVDEAIDRYPQFSVLNSCRVLWSYTSGDVVVSKQEASDWAVGTMAAQWSTLISSAQRVYARTSDRADETLLTDRSRDFVAHVRERVARLR